MESNGVVTLTTDFGLRDPYAGIMRGMILSANSDAHVVDITHGVPAHDILNGAFVMAQSYAYFPEGTVHVAVVDPGVGGPRKNVAVLTERYMFVGPDNGIFSIALNREKIVEFREIVNRPFVADTVSQTFHGRDVYAPCAGHLSSGKSFQKIGPRMGRLNKLSFPSPRVDGDELRGEVIAIDSFGNMITNISERSFSSFARNMNTEIYFGATRFATVADNYSAVPAQSPLVLFGSAGYLEISMKEGNAAKYFMTSTGSPVLVRRY